MLASLGFAVDREEKLVRTPLLLWGESEKPVSKPSMIVAIVISPSGPRPEAASKRRMLQTEGVKRSGSFAHLYRPQETERSTQYKAFTRHVHHLQKLGYLRYAKLTPSGGQLVFVSAVQHLVMLAY